MVRHYLSSRFTDFALVVADFLGLSPAALGASVVLGFAFSGFAPFLVAVACGWVGASMAGCGMGLGTLALIIRPLGRRGSITRPGSSAQQRVPPGSLSGQQHVCLLRLSCGHVQASALQARPSTLSISDIHGSSPCGCPHSCSTEAVPAEQDNHQRDESPHTRRTEEHIRSSAMYGRSAGNACIGAGPLAPRTSQSLPTDRRAR